MEKQFEQFRASLLHCPRCRAAMPVRERLLLVLPDGSLFEYLCTRCAGSLGTRKESQKREAKIIA